MIKDSILLIDCVGSAELSLNEGTSGKSTFVGKFQEANKCNKNKRMYTYEALDRNMKSLFEAVKSRGLYGELDHASDSIVHLSNASHLVTRLWWEGSVLMGEGEILPTPSGRVLKAIVDAGGRIGISSRGVGNGSTNSEGVLVIDESFKLITFDVVADPSTFDAYQKFGAKRIKETFEERRAEHRVDISPNIDKKAKINPNVVSYLIGNLIKATK